jgi:hypothetical protein
MRVLAGCLTILLAACGVDGEPEPPVDIAVSAGSVAKPE